ncbi:hypothetical protein BH24ACT5_BH24ACT5_01540 [soil metagenome]
MLNTTIPPVTPPVVNNRGAPWSSVGGRNLGWAGTGLGNGGVTPPGSYPRRRDCLKAGTHDRMWREHWLRLVNQALIAGELNPTQHAVAAVLAEHSNQHGAHVYPGHHRLGDMVQRSRSTVRRALKRLRELELIDWEHRFRKPDTVADHPRGTSNLYAFLLPAVRLAAAGLRQPRPPRANNGGRTTAPKRVPHHDAAESFAAAEAQQAATFDEARERIDAAYLDRPDVAAFAVDALTRYWGQYRAPPG